jgi:hypothetical protein
MLQTIFIKIIEPTFENYIVILKNRTQLVGTGFWIKCGGPSCMPSDHIQKADKGRRKISKRKKREMEKEASQKKGQRTSGEEV